MDPSVLIVGAGTFGTSTAYHLAQSYKDASRVTVLDQSPSPPKLAASIDVNRIIRTDYPNPLYCQLAFEAIHAWFWSLELGPFFHKSGWIMMDEKGSDLSERVHKVFEDRGSHQTEDVPLDKLDESRGHSERHGYQGLPETPTGIPKPDGVTLPVQPQVTWMQQRSVA